MFCLVAMRFQLRIAEWVVLAFGAFCVAFVAWKAGFEGLSQLDMVWDERGRRIFVALMIVGTVHLARDFFRQPSQMPPRYQRLLNVTLVFAVLPLLLAAWVHSLHPSWNGFWSKAADDKLHLVAMAILRVLGMGSPFIATWLFVATEIRKRQGFVFRAVVIDGLSSLAASLREWFPLLVMIPAYSWMEGVIGTPERDFDGVMQAVDRFIFFGVDPVSALQAIIWAPLSEWLAFSYSFYALLYPIGLAAIFMQKGKPALREGVTALSLGLAICYVGYALLPVKGPALSQQFDVSLDLYFVKEVKEMLMDSARITYDCFPSFHTAGSLILSWLCFRHARAVFWWTLPMVLSTPFACVYLRYHYVSDVLGGVALFAVVIWATPRLLARYGETSSTPVSSAAAIDQPSATS